MERVLQHQVVRIAPPAGGTLNQFDSLPRTPFHWRSGGGACCSRGGANPCENPTDRLARTSERVRGAGTGSEPRKCDEGALIYGFTYFLQGPQTSLVGRGRSGASGWGPGGARRDGDRGALRLGIMGRRRAFTALLCEAPRTRGSPACAHPRTPAHVRIPQGPQPATGPRVRAPPPLVAPGEVRVIHGTA